MNGEPGSVESTSAGPGASAGIDPPNGYKPVPDLSPYIHKKIDFRYSGCDLCLELSHALFSSFDVDRGTRLLLKTIAQKGIAEGARSLLDLGCGVGVLGLALGAALPDCALHFRDRDALAAGITLRNARGNGREPASCGTGLTLTGLAGRRYDFIVSNVPAKAGPPVIADLVRRLPGALTESGSFALVVVNPLVRALREALSESGATRMLEEAGPGHTVFAGGRGRELPPPADELAPYERCRAAFSLEGASYELTGYWGLPEFDTPSYAAVLAAGLCERACAGSLIRSVSIHNPGPGHAVLYACIRFEPSRLSLISRDLLQLTAARRNLAAAGFFPELSQSDGLDPMATEAASADLIVELPEAIPEVDWIQPVWERASRIAKRGASLVYVSRPTEAVRFDKRRPGGWVRRFGRKRDGFQGLVYRREG